MSNRSDGGRDRTQWRVSTVFKPLLDHKAQASDSAWAAMLGVMTSVIRSVMVRGIEKVKTFFNIHTDVWGKTYALVTPAQVSIWAATKGKICPQVVYATVDGDSARFLNEKFVFFVVVPSTKKEGLFDVRYLKFSSQAEEKVAVMALGFWSNMDWKRKVRLKVDKYIGSWLSPCESVMVRPRGSDEWVIVRCDGSLTHLRGDIKVIREVDPKGHSEGLVEIVSSLDKIVNIKSGLGMRRTKTRAEFGDGHEKGMSMVVSDNVDWDIRIHDKSKSAFFRMGNVEFVSFGHEAVSGKLFYSDVTTVTLSTSGNDQMLKAFLAAKNENLDAAVKMTTNPDYLQKIYDLSAGGVGKMASIVKYLSKYMSDRGVEAVSGATVNLMMEGLNPFLVPWSTERALLWADGHFKTILRKLRLPMNNAVRVYPVIYLPDSMGEYTSPTVGNPTLEVSKDGYTVCLIHKDDWQAIFEVSGGPDFDDSWGFMFFRVGGKLKGFWARQPFGPGDGWFTGNLSVSQELLSKLGIEPMDQEAYQEIHDTTMAIRKEAVNVAKYEELLKSAGYLVKSGKAPRAVESTDKITKGALALLSVHGRNTEDTKLEVGKKADHMLADDDEGGLEIGMFTNVLILARINIENKDLTETEKKASWLLCVLTFFFQLVEPVVDKLAGLDERKEKLYQLATNAYWYFVRNNRVVDFGFMDRLPLVSVGGKIFGWKRLRSVTAGMIPWPMEEDGETHKLSADIRAQVESLYHNGAMFDHRRDGGATKFLTFEGQAELLRIFGYKVTNGPVSTLRQGIHDTYSYLKLESFGITAAYQKRFLVDLLGALGVDKDTIGNNTVLNTYVGIYPASVLEAVADTLNVWGSDFQEIEDRYKETFLTVEHKLNGWGDDAVVSFFEALQMAQMLRVRVDRRAISENERGRSEKPIFKCFLHEFVHGSEKSPGLNEGIEALRQLKNGTPEAEYNRVAQSIVTGGVIITAYGESTLDSMLFSAGPCLLPKGEKDPSDEDGVTRLTTFMVNDRSFEQWSAIAFRKIVTTMTGGEA